MKTPAVFVLLLACRVSAFPPKEESDTLFKLRADMTALQSLTQDQQTEAEMLKKQLQEQEAKLAGQAAKLGGQQTEIEKLKEQLQDQQTEAEKLKKQLQEQEAKLEGQAAKLGGQEAKLGGQATKLGGQQTEIEKLKEQLQDQQTEAETLKKQLQDQQTEAEKLKKQLQDQQTEVDELKKQPQGKQVSLSGKQVAFSASLSASGDQTIGPSDQHTPLVFKHVVTNIGNAYSPVTGNFTAPLKGAYHFEWHIHGNGGQYANSGVLFKNSEHIFAAYEFQYSGGTAASNGASLLLEAGDVVSVHEGPSATVFDNVYHHTTFSGHMLFTM